LALVEALKQENYNVTYQVYKVRQSGALEVYVKNGSEKTKVFSKIESGVWLDDEEVKRTVAIIKNSE